MDEAYVCRLTARSCPDFESGFGGVLADTTNGSGRASALVRLGRVAGPAVVRVTVPELGYVDSVRYTVQPGAAARVTFEARSVGLAIGARQALRARVVDRSGNARTDAVTYSLAPSPAGVATLDASAATLAGVDLGAVYVFARAAATVDSALVRVVPPGRLLLWENLSRTVLLAGTDGSAPRTLATDASSDFGTFPRFSPNGATLAFHAGPAGAFGGTPQRIVIMDSTGANRREIGVPSGMTAVVQARPLADGRVLFIARAAQQFPSGIAPAALYAVSATDVVTKVADLPDVSTLYGGIQISPDGSRVAYVAADPGGFGRPAGLRVWTAETGAIATVNGAGVSPSWSPDGRRLAYLIPPVNTGGFSGTILISDPNGGNGVVRTSSGSFSPGLAWSPDGAYLLGRSSDFPGALRVVRVRDGVTMDLGLAIPGRGGSDFYQPDWR